MKQIIFTETGETRPPKAGEYFEAGAQVAYTDHDFDRVAYHIYTRTEREVTPEPQLPKPPQIIEQDGQKYEWTGEHRLPNADEHFYDWQLGRKPSGAKLIGHARRDFHFENCYIYRKLDSPVAEQAGEAQKRYQIMMPVRQDALDGSPVEEDVAQFDNPQLAINSLKMAVVYDSVEDKQIYPVSDQAKGELV